MKFEGEKKGFFFRADSVLDAYIFLEVFEDVCRENKNTMDGLSKRIEELTLKKDEASHRALRIIELQYSDKENLGWFLTELKEHINDYKRSRDWAELGTLSNYINRERVSDELGSVLQGKMKNSYKKYRETKRNTEQYLQKAEMEQKISETGIFTV